MHTPKFLLAAATAVAAAGLALVPTAQATNPTGTAVNYVSVGGNSADVDYGLTGTLKAGGSVTMKIYGSNKTLNCYSGSFTGTVHAGATTGAHYKWASMSSLSMNCDTFMPGRTLTISVPADGCAGFWVNDALKPSINVHDGLVDSGAKGGKLENVYGALRIPHPACSVTATTSGGCTLKFGDAILAQFDESLKSTSPVIQDLILEGNALKVKQIIGSCLGIVTVGDSVTMNNLRFNVTVNGGAGAIDFRTNP